MSASRLILRPAIQVSRCSFRVPIARALHVSASRSATPWNPPSDIEGMMNTPKAQEILTKLAGHPEALKSMRNVMQVLEQHGGVKPGARPSFMTIVGLLKNKEVADAINNLSTELEKAGIAMDRSIMKEMMASMKGKE